MDPYKTNRLNAAIQRALSELIATRVKDPRVGLVSVSQVELNRDHSRAKVFVAVTGDEEERDLSLTGLRTASGFLQGQLGRMLRLRTVPDLDFQYDDSMDRGFGVEEVLRDLEEQGEFDDEAARRRRLTLEDFEPPPDLLDPLVAAETVWIAGHWNPDPDCTGAALALAAVLRDLDKDAVVFRYPDPPLGLTGLPGWEDTVPIDEAPDLLAASSPDLVVLVDCHRTDRCGPLQETLDRIDQVVCIDHHLVSGRRAPVPGWLEDRAESTCTLVFRVIQELVDDPDEALDVDVATNIFAGLAGDTGGFRFDNTGPSTFRLAADLSERGVDTAAVQHRLLHLRRRQGLDLVARALAAVHYAGGGRVAVMAVTQADLAATGANLAETEGLVNLLTAVDGVRYAAMLKEVEENVWRASLRTHTGDVQAVAATFGGGGHQRAAGCTLAGTGDEVRTRLTEALLAAE
jgi:phosphoesterase RecJ-like protein